MLRSLLLTAALVATACPAAGIALETPRSVEVKYGDLDLSSAAGRTRLSKRVKAAARTACAANSAYDLSAKIAADKCVRTALDAAQPRIAAAVAKAGERLAFNATRN